MVLDPAIDVEWGYPASAWSVLLIVAVPYIVLVWSVLRRKCKIDGAVCSFRPITEIEMDDETSQTSHSETAPLSPGLRPHRSDLVEEPKPDEENRDDEVYRPGVGCWGCCGWFKEPIGRWHGGRAEAEASGHYGALRATAGKWLDALDDLTGGAELPEHIEILLDRIQIEAEKMGRGFWVGNQMVWCCARCTKQPEERLCDAAEQLAMEISDNPVDELTGPDGDELLMELEALICTARYMMTLRRRSIEFLSSYSLWFWRFFGEWRYTEVIHLCYALIFAVSVGMLQRNPKVQAPVALGINCCMLAFTVYVRPFNERARNVFEIVAMLCFNMALWLVMFHAYGWATNDMAINMLMLGSMLFKGMYQYFKMFAWLCKVCTGKTPEAEAEADGRLDAPEHDQENPCSLEHEANMEASDDVEASENPFAADEDDDANAETSQSGVGIELVDIEQPGVESSELDQPAGDFDDLPEFDENTQQHGIEPSELDQPAGDFDDLPEFDENTEQHDIESSELDQPAGNFDDLPEFDETAFNNPVAAQQGSDLPEIPQLMPLSPYSRGTDGLRQMIDDAAQDSEDEQDHGPPRPAPG